METVTVKIDRYTFNLREDEINSIKHYNSKIDAIKYIRSKYPILGLLVTKELVEHVIALVRVSCPECKCLFTASNL